MENLIREKAKDSNQITREYFDEILVEMRHIDGTIPDTTLNLYGKTFKTPIMMAALSHIKGKNNQGDGMVEMAQGAKISGSVNWAGMMTIEQAASVLSVDVPTIEIIKPYANENLVLEHIQQAETLGALAVGMDLDHSFNAKGEYDNVLDHPMRPRTLKDIKQYCKNTKLPFVIKGVLSVVDAQKCLDAGVQGIVVSHHHGIMPTAVPPLMVLADIAKIVKGKMPIFLDCGIMNGADVFKALALGATAVSVGRAIMPGITKDGSSGAAHAINSITQELAGMMARTACPNLNAIDSSLLWRRNGNKI